MPMDTMATTSKQMSVTVMRAWAFWSLTRFTLMCLSRSDRATLSVLRWIVSTIYHIRHGVKKIRSLCC